MKPRDTRASALWALRPAPSGPRLAPWPDPYVRIRLVRHEVLDDVRLAEIAGLSIQLGVLDSEEKGFRL